MDAKESEVYLGILLFSILLAIIIIGFTVSYFKQHRKLNREKIKAEIYTSETEKKKIASDLHDDLGPILATIKIYVNALSLKEGQDKELIKNINKYLDGGIMRVKTMANGLMPNTLQRKGLKQALEEYIFNIETYVKFNITLHFPEMKLQLGSTAELNIYRVIQEIITNTIKHSKASELRLNFEKKDNNLLIQTSDNGCGFAYTDHNFNSTGYGISNIKSRIEMLEGKYNIYSRPGEGISYAFFLPLNKLQQSE
jgi:two-component system, NarL family, sensor kinase